MIIKKVGEDFAGLLKEIDWVKLKKIQNMNLYLDI